MRPSRISTRSRSAYGEGSDHSYFADLAAVAESDQRYKGAIAPAFGGLSGSKGLGSSGVPGPGDDGLEAASKRLASVRDERDSTTTATTSIGEMFGPSNGSVPGFIADRYSLSVRSRAALATALPQEPLPKGTTIRTMRLSTGAAAGVQATQNTDAIAQDPLSSIVESPITTLSGMVNPQPAGRRLVGDGRQARPRARPGARAPGTVAGSIRSPTATAPTCSCCTPAERPTSTSRPASARLPRR